MKFILLSLLCVVTFFAHTQTLSNVALDLNPGGEVYDVAYDNNSDVYVVVGDFTSIQGQSRQNLAFIDANTLQVTSNNPVNSIDGHITSVEYLNAIDSSGQAFFTLNMMDSWGDGWNGNLITILADGIPVLENATLDNGSFGTITFSAPAGSVLTATWVTGSFTSEVSNTVADASGTIIAGGDFGNTIDYTIPNLTSSNISNHFLYIGGSFTNINGQARKVMARLKNETFGLSSIYALDQYWAAPFENTSNIISDFEMAGDTIVAIGDISYPSSPSVREWMVAFDASSFPVAFLSGMTFAPGFFSGPTGAAVSGAVKLWHLKFFDKKFFLDGLWRFDRDGSWDGNVNNCFGLNVPGPCNCMSSPCFELYQDFNIHESSHDTIMMGLNIFYSSNPSSPAPSLCTNPMYFLYGCSVLNCGAEYIGDGIGFNCINQFGVADPYASANLNFPFVNSTDVGARVESYNDKVFSFDGSTISVTERTPSIYDEYFPPYMSIATNLNIDFTYVDTSSYNFNFADYRQKMKVVGNKLFISDANLEWVEQGVPRQGLAVYCLGPEISEGYTFTELDTLVCHGDIALYSIPDVEYAEGYYWEYTGSGATYRIANSGDSFEPLDTVHISSLNGNSIEVYFTEGTGGELRVKPYSTCSGISDYVYAKKFSVNIEVNPIPEVNIAEETLAYTCIVDALNLEASSNLLNMDWEWTYGSDTAVVAASTIQGNNIPGPHAFATWVLPFETNISNNNTNFYFSYTGDMTQLINDPSNYFTVSNDEVYLTSYTLTEVSNAQGTIGIVYWDGTDVTIVPGSTSPSTYSLNDLAQDIEADFFSRNNGLEVVVTPKVQLSFMGAGYATFSDGYVSFEITYLGDEETVQASNQIKNINIISRYWGLNNSLTTDWPYNTLPWELTYDYNHLLGTNSTLSIGSNSSTGEQNEGYYYVTGNVPGTDSATGCFGLDSVLIFFDTIAASPNPTSNVQTPAIFDCTALSVAMTNTTPDADISWVLNSDPNNVLNDFVIYNTDDSLEITCLITYDSNGCQAELPYTIDVNQQTLDGQVQGYTGSQTATLDCSIPNLTLECALVLPSANGTVDWIIDGAEAGSTLELSIADTLGMVNGMKTYTYRTTNLVNGCTEEYSIAVFFDFEEPNIEPYNGPSSVNCSASDLELVHALSGGNVQEGWLDASGTNTNSASLIVNEIGSYYYEVLSLDNGCSIQDIVTIIQNTELLLDAPDDITLCDGETGSVTVTAINSTAPTTYTWSNGQVGPSIDLLGGTDNSVSVAASTSTGCIGNATITVNTIAIPEVNIAENSLTYTCFVDTFDIAVSSNVQNITWAWTYGSGTQLLGSTNTLSVGTNSAPEEQTGGYYYVTGTEPIKACMGIDSVMILIDTVAATPDPISNIQTPDIFDCTASSVAMTNTTPDADISWMLNSDLNNVLNDFVIYNTDDSLEITCLITYNSNGCQVQLPYTIVVDTVTIEGQVLDYTEIDTLNCDEPNLTLECVMMVLPSSNGTVDWIINGAETGVTLELSIADTLGMVNGTKSYTYRTTNLDNGCTTDYSTDVSFDFENPNMEPYSGPSTINCSVSDLELVHALSGGNVEEGWLDASGTNTNSASLIVNEIGTHYYEVLSLDNGCVIQDTIDVIIHPFTQTDIFGPEDFEGDMGSDTGLPYAWSASGQSNGYYDLIYYVGNASDANFTLSMWDDVDNGWGGNEITIYADNIPVLENATFSDPEGFSESITFSAPKGSVLTATWTTDSAWWITNDISFRILDASYSVVHIGDYGDEIGYTVPVGNWSVPEFTQFAYSNDDLCSSSSGCDKSADRLILPPQDFSNYIDEFITLKADLYQDGRSGSTGFIEVSTDEGNTWTNIYAVPGVQDVWQNTEVNLSNYIGESNVLIAFRFNDSGGHATGLAVDNVSISVISEYPDLLLELQEDMITLCDGATGSLSVEPINNDDQTDYTWSNGQSGSMVNLLGGTDSLVSVFAINSAGCIGLDTITVNTIPNPPIVPYNGPSTINCSASDLELVHELSGGNVQEGWLDASGTNTYSPSLIVNEIGTHYYEVLSLDNGCVIQDTVEIIIDTIVETLIFGPETFEGDLDASTDLPNLWSESGLSEDGMYHVGNTDDIFTLNMLDDWEDGWNENYITILADGIPVLVNATLDDGDFGTETFSAPPGSVLTATWIEGQWAYEISFEIVNSSGAVVDAGDFGNTIDYTVPVGSWIIPEHTQFAKTDDDLCGNPLFCDKSQDRLILPPQDFSSYSNEIITLKAEVYHDGICNWPMMAGSSASVEVSIDNGVTWSHIYTIPEVDGSWQNIEVPILNYNGQYNVFIAFRFNDSDFIGGVGGISNGLAVDDVSITASSHPELLLELQDEILLCDGQTGSVSASPINNSEDTDYIWSNGLTGQTIDVLGGADSVVYLHAFTASGCVGFDTINVPESLPEVSILEEFMAFTCVVDSFDVSAQSNIPNLDWEWRYGDNTLVVGNNDTLSVGENSGPVEQNGGYYYVTGTVPNFDECFGVDSVRILIDNIAAAADPASNVQEPAGFGCSTDSLYMTNTTPDASFAWVLTSDPNNPLDDFVIYNADDSLEVTCLITYNSNGCETQLPYEIQTDAVTLEGQVVGYTGLLVDTLDCNNPTATLECALSASSANGSVEWIVGGQGIGTTLNLTIEDTVGMVNGAKTYTYRTTNFDNGCTADINAVVSFDFEGPFIVPYDGPSSINCSVSELELLHPIIGGNVEEGWLDTSSTNTYDPVLFVNEVGSYFYEVLSLDNGCSSMDTVEIILTNELLLDLPEEITLCGGQIDSLTATTINNIEATDYTWSNGASGSTVSLLGGTDTLISVIAQNTSGCIGYDTVTVNTATPVEAVLEAYIGCAGGSIQVLSVTGGMGNYSYSMDASTWQQEPVFYGLPLGEHTIFIQDDLGCVYSFMETIDENTASFDINFLASTYNAKGDTIAIVNISNYTGFDGIEWILPEGAIVHSIDDSMVVMSMDVAGWYDVTIVGYKDTCSYTFTNSVYFGDYAPVFEEDYEQMGITGVNIYPVPILGSSTFTVDLTLGVSQNYVVLVTNYLGQPIPGMSQSGVGQSASLNFTLPGVSPGNYIVHIIADYDALQQTIVVQ